MLGDLFPSESNPASEDERFMRLALAEARRALGRVAPNPAVGAIIVRDGEIVGHGATQPPPGHHAEMMALGRAGERARGATLYVTLEPCSHQGRTPPCADAVIARGIRRVVIGTLDPHPLVNGGGVGKLRAAGIEVEVGCLEDEARSLIAGFSSRVSRGRPHTLVKYATTLDGKIVTRTGHSRWISGPESRELCHILRDRSDAIMVGSGTVLGDNPRLTTRLPDELSGYGGAHDPRRVVIDGDLRTPSDASVLAPDPDAPPIVYCTPDAPADAERQLIAAGALVRRVAARDCHVDLLEVLRDLGELGCNQLFVEGGGGLIGALFDARLVDEVVCFIAPLFVGGGGPAPVRGRGVATMPEAHRLVNRRMRWSGDDIMLHGRVEYREAGDV